MYINQFGPQIDGLFIFKKYLTLKVIPISSKFVAIVFVKLQETTRTSTIFN